MVSECVGLPCSRSNVLRMLGTEDRTPEIRSEFLRLLATSESWRRWLGKGWWIFTFPSGRLILGASWTASLPLLLLMIFKGAV